MAGEGKEFFDKFKKAAAKMKEQAPETVNGFATMFSKIMQAGALSVKEKEFVALGIGVAQRCEPCIGCTCRNALTPVRQKSRF